MDCQSDPELGSWSTKFRFDTDERRVDGLKQLQREIEPLMFKVEKTARALRVSDGRDLKCCLLACFLLRVSSERGPELRRQYDKWWSRSALLDMPLS